MNKRLIHRLILSTLMLFFISIATMAHAIEWKVTNQSTITWDAVTVNSSGDVMPVGDVITYKVYIVEETAAKSTAVEIDETDQLNYTITFINEGRWLAGVQSIRTPAASPTDIQESSITWSDVIDVAVVPVPFGFVYFETPADPAGLGPV